MLPSPPREMDTILPPLLLFVIPSNHQVPAPYLPFLLCSSYFPLSNPASTSNPSPTSTPIPNLPLSYFLFPTRLLLLLLPQLLAERKRLSDQFYYNYYREKFKVS